MSQTSQTSLTFLPWLRSGLGAISIPATDQDQDKVRRKVSVSAMLVDESGISLLSEQKPHTEQFILKSPGEVAGFSPLMVARTEPKNKENDFEPNYFPYVEFIDPDYPWRYSLGNDINGKLIPWIVLIVLKSDEFAVGANSNNKQPTILIKKKDDGRFPLPDLSQSWAWSFVQLTGILPDTADTDYKEKLGKYLSDNPGMHCSRLMCPRRLEPLTLYSAFVIPTYEIGRLAGMNLPINIDVNKDKFSWAQDNNEIELPVFFHWGFQTSEAGDFEKLIDLIQFKSIPIDKDGKYLVGIRNIDGKRPGFLRDDSGNQRIFPDDTFKLEGALTPPGFFEESDESENEKRDKISLIGFTQYVLPELNTSLEEAPIHETEDIDPLISIPVYGRYFQRTEEIVAPNNQGKWDTPNCWIHELNLDRRYRIPASFGTTVVQVNQEEYMKECWEQVGAIREANENLRLGAIGKLIGEGLKARHIDPLNDERFTLITQPFHHYYINDNGHNQKSFKSRFNSSGLPKGTVSYVFKRIVSHKVGFDKANLFGPWKLAEKNDSWWRKMLKYLIYLLKLLILFLIALYKKIQQFSRFIPFLQKLYFYLKVPAANEVVRQPDRDTTLQNDLKNEFSAAITLPDIYPLKSEIIPVSPINIKDSFRPKFDMSADLLERVNTTIKVPWLGVLKSFDPIMKAPKIDLSMYKHLSERSVDLMVPGLGNLEKNSAILLEENRKFIAAYMVGLSHEMGRELVWREFPTDQRGTIFNYFWDPTQSDNAPTDISDIHTWNDGLGANTSLNESQGENRLVLAIKADLIRRYPDTIFFAVKKNKTKAWEKLFEIFDGDKTDDPNGIEHLNNNQLKAKDDSFYIIPPIFSAHIGVDVLFLGFPFSKEDIDSAAKQNYEYFFVIMEHPSLPRFGVDEGEKYFIKSYNGIPKVATVDREWATIPDNINYYRIFLEGQVQDGTEVKSIVLAADASNIDDQYKGLSIEIVKGRGFGQSRIITNYNGNSKKVTVDNEWQVIPDKSSVYRIVIVQGRVKEGTTDTISLANDASGTNDAYKGMFLIFIDLHKTWDNLSWEHLQIDPNSHWIDIQSLKIGVTNIPPSPQNPKWGDNSASMASITYQKPVRIVIPSDKFLKPIVVTSVTPSSGHQDQMLDATIIGTNFTKATGVSFGAGITVNRFTVDLNTQITANIKIASNASLGARDVSVTKDKDSGILDAGFMIG